MSDQKEKYNVFFVLETSARMAGENIETIRDLFEKCREELVRLFDDDKELNIAVLEYKRSWMWHTPYGLEDIKGFALRPLKAGGSANLGAALRELNYKLSAYTYLQGSSNTLMPLIIFLTSGHSTDDYMPELEKLRKNSWYVHANKVAFAIGKDADTEALGKIVAFSEMVRDPSDIDLLGRLAYFSHYEYDGPWDPDDPPFVGPYGAE